MPFCSCWGERKGVGGSSQAPWLCSITRESQPRAPRGGSGDVRQGPHAWVGDDGGDVSGFDSQPDSASEPGPSGFPRGWYGVRPLSRRRCAARRCPVSVVPWAVPVPSSGTLAPKRSLWSCLARWDGSGHALLVMGLPSAAAAHTPKWHSWGPPGHCTHRHD